MMWRNEIVIINLGNKLKGSVSSASLTKYLKLFETKRRKGKTQDNRTEGGLGGWRKRVD